MNQFVRIDAGKVEQATWYLAPDAVKLIASLRANPPALVERVQHFPITTDRWTEFAPDSRIERLRAIENEAFLAAERADPEHGAQAFIDEQPSVDDILAGIGGHEQLFLGERVNQAFDGLLPDMLARHPLDPVNDCVFDEVVVS